MSPQTQEFAARRQRLAAQLKDRRSDALVVTFLPNVRYLSGFTGSNAVLVLGAERAELLTDPRYTIQARDETDVRVHVKRGSLLTAAAEILSKRKAHRVGFESTRIGWEAWDTLRRTLRLGTDLRPWAGAIEQLRMVKSASEVEAIQRSVELNSRAYEQALRSWKPGMSERDLAAEIDYRMGRLGAERPAFDTIVASGARSALPHAQPTRAAIESGRLLLIDMGSALDGYASDMTRTVAVGRVPAGQRRAYGAVLEAQLAGIASVKPGVPAARVDQAVRRVLRGHGLEREFVHSTGHGLGLEIHEGPRLGKKDKTPLEEGMVITIEPGIYREGEFGIRIEDTVRVTAQGAEVLTPTAKEFTSI